MKKMLLALLLVISMLAMTACSAATPTTSTEASDAGTTAPAVNAASAPDSVSGAYTALTHIKQKGKIVVGCDPAVQNLNVMDAATGQYVGFVPDLINGWAEALGVEVEWQTLEWSAMLTALNTGKVDIVAADMNRTVARAASITFTDPWIVDRTMVSVMKDSPYQTFEDLQKPGTKFAIVAGSAFEKIIPQIFPQSQTVVVPMGGWLDAMKSGIVDVNFNGTVSIMTSVSQNPDDLRAIVPEKGQTPSFRCSFAVAQGDYALAQCFNVYLSEIKLDGKYAEMYKKWIGLDWQPNYDGVAY